MMDMIRSAEGPTVAGVLQKLRARWVTANTILYFLGVRATYHHSKFDTSVLRLQLRTCTSAA